MSKQNNTGMTPVDLRIQELLNGSIDDELSTAEQAELDQFLFSSQSVRDLNEELKAVTHLLDELPVVEPPAYLQGAIESQGRLPVQADAMAKKPGILGDWLGANWLRTGFALAAGAVLTISVYEMGSRPITPEEAASMSGTMVKNIPADHQGSLVDSAHLNTAQLDGLVELRSKDDLFTLDVNLKSEGPFEVVVDFAGRGLDFDGATREQDPEVAISIKDGSVHLASSGEQHFTVTLKRVSKVQKIAPLALDFFADDQLVQKTELIISQD